jgi:hypothetical protein
MKLHENATKRAAAVYEGLEELYNEIHSHKYDYSKAEYLNSKTKMCIICPEHGEFWQNHNKHGSTKQGCPVCAGKQVGNAKEFTEKAKEVHGDKYDYSKVEYIKRHKKVTIVCPIHGAFEQIPTNHLRGKGCDKCAHDMLGLKKRVTKKDFLSKANQIHEGRYSYGRYTKISDKVEIICATHGIFWQVASSHLLGCGCPSCVTGGFSPAKPGILYYIAVAGGTAYKIGITNRSVEQRFGNNADVRVVREWYYENGEDCYKEEQRILKEFSEHKYTGDKLLDSGHTEMFYKDVLLLDSI